MTTPIEQLTQRFAGWRAAAPERVANREARQMERERRRTGCQSCGGDMPRVRPNPAYQACSTACADNIFAEQAW